MGQGRREYETAEIDHAGLFADDGQHFIGDPPGQTRLGKNRADYDGTENKKNGGIHKVVEGRFRGTYKKQGLKQADSQAGNPDGHDFEHPPCGGKQKYCDCTLPFLR